MKEARFVVLVLTVFFVIMAPLNVYSVEHAKEYSSTAISPTSKTAYPNTTLIEIDNENSIYTAGTYSDIQPSFIQQKPTLCINDTTPGFSKEFNGGGFDGYVIKLNASGEAIEYSTYIGGSEKDTLSSLALNSEGKVFVSGNTLSAEEDLFPIGKNIPGYNSTYYRREDIPIIESFVMCIDMYEEQYVFSTYLSPK